jgi:hypothetical protein
LKFWLSLATLYALFLFGVYREAVRYTPGIAVWVQVNDGLHKLKK